MSLVVSLLLFGAPLAGAPRSGSSSPSTASIGNALVMLVDVSQETMVARAKRAVRAQLVGLPVRVRVHRVTRFPAELPTQLELARRILRKGDTMAVFWCDIHLRQRIYLYLATSRGERVVVRSIGGLDDAGRMEAMALILRQAVKALLAGGTIGVYPSSVPLALPRLQVRPAATTARSHQPRRSRHRVGIEAAYALEGFSSARRVAHGFWGAVLWRIRPWWSVFAGFILGPPITGEGQYASMRLTRYLVLFGARAHWQAGRFRLGGSLAINLEYVVHRTTSTVAYPDVDRNDLLVAVTPTVHFEIVLSSRARAFLAAGIQAYFNNLHYVVTGEGVRDVLLKPWAIRPHLLLGMSIDLL